tara:strand:+ start:4614 stop:5198 length:585 start_codon:yes stop_codon:yes gene_type:complete
MFLYTNDDDNDQNINIDDLYDKNQQRDLKQLSIFNKLLNRIHNRIKITGRTKSKDKYIWYNVPEYIFGEPCYNQGDCIGYLVMKLQNNGFHTKYLHPNTLFVSWGDWIPSYIRAEIKKKTGMVIDEKGNKIEKKSDEENVVDEEDINAGLFNDRSNPSTQPNKKVYTPINEYKPTGNLVYKNEMFEKIEKKINN